MRLNFYFIKRFSLFQKPILNQNLCIFDNIVTCVSPLSIRNLKKIHSECAHELHANQFPKELDLLN